MDLGLNNKTALVTGASRGLGKAVAAALVAEGAKVAICARDTTRLEAAAKEIGAIGIAADLSQAGAVDAVLGVVVWVPWTISHLPGSISQPVM